MNSTKNDYDIQASEHIRDNVCFQDVFEAQVAQAPNTIALIYRDRRVKYRDPSERSNQLAWRLIGLGVQPDMLVGVCVARSLNMVVALLSVLKAGGAYMPLDSSCPKERLVFILADDVRIESACSGWSI